MIPQSDETGVLSGPKREFQRFLGLFRHYNPNFHPFSSQLKYWQQNCCKTWCKGIIMEQRKFIAPFAKSRLTGLFVGTMATITLLIFGLSYKTVSLLTFGEIHVSPVLLLTFLILLTVGILVAVFRDLFRLGTLVYNVLIIGLTAFCIWKTMSIERLEGDKISVGLRTLMSAMLILLGCASLIIPVFFNSGRMNEERDPRFSR